MAAPEPNTGPSGAGREWALTSRSKNGPSASPSSYLQA